MRRQPEHGLEGDMPVEAAIVSEDKLVEVRIEVLSAQPMVGAQPPTLHQREDPVNPGQATWPAILPIVRGSCSVIGEPRIGFVAVGEQRGSAFHVGPHKGIDGSRRVVRDRSEANPAGPRVQVFCAHFLRGLARLAAAVDHLDGADDKDFPGFRGIEKAVVGPERNFGSDRLRPRPPAARASDRPSSGGASAPAAKRSCR